jgi:hypothetical protein
VCSDCECGEPDDSRAHDRTVDLIACATVGHKVKQHRSKPGGLYIMDGKPDGHVWHWTTCDRCGVHISGEIPETYLDRAAREMSRRAAEAMFGSLKGPRFWEGLAREEDKPEPGDKFFRLIQ